MERLTLIIPALYGDHHVASVRRLLESMPGVSEISLSPAAHAASFQLDSVKQTREAIATALASAGYAVGDPERAMPSPGPGTPRHTATPEVRPENPRREPLGWPAPDRTDSGLLLEGHPRGDGLWPERHFSPRVSDISGRTSGRHAGLHPRETCLGGPTPVALPGLRPDTHP